MTLHELVRAASRSAYETQTTTAIVLRSVAEIIAEAVKRGETVAIPGFGTFYPKRHKARRIVHPPGTPDAGKPLEIPGQKSIGFRSAKAQKRKTRAPRGMR
jgi:DNA-binding protein HU-beta